MPKQPAPDPTVKNTKCKKRTRDEPPAIDVYALMIGPVQVRKGEHVEAMDPYEIFLHRQLELALKERSAAAMKRKSSTSPSRMA